MVDYFRFRMRFYLIANLHDDPKFPVRVSVSLVQ